ncbi:MAG: helix-turn-helix domain-containing protein [Desulfobacterales bacterium]|nr:helix-turn-helix domain-containing protein [Desulfobacterales bacterium]
MTTALTNNVQIIKHGGKPAFAVIPWDDYQTLVESVGSDESGVWFPNEVVQANIRGDSLIKSWREYKGMTQAELAANAGIKQPALARMEKPDANPRKSSLVKLAYAMGITVEQLIE